MGFEGTHPPLAMREALDIRRPHKPVADGVYVLTHHALNRMWERRVSREAVEAALTYGRLIRQDRRLAFVIGRKEVERYGTVRGEHEAVDLSGFEGVQVRVNDEGFVVTVLHETDFRALRRPRARDRQARSRSRFAH